MTPNDFLKVIQDTICPTYTTAPDGWYCVKDLMNIWNYKKANVQRKINAGIKVGIVESKDFLIKKPKGARKVRYYFFHDEKKRKSKN